MPTVNKEHLSENIEVCWRCAYHGAVALPALSLKHPKLVKQTAKKIGGEFIQTPFFGGKIRFDEKWLEKVRSIGPDPI
jgi:hypothetical protein